MGGQSQSGGTKTYNAAPMEQLIAILKHYWGYDTFRPLQREAMASVMAHRDSVVVLPTGGGKSLCYQAPALALPGTAVVVSPLIALMKDQVDGLRLNGVSSAYLNSSLSPSERGDVERRLLAGDLKLLYVAPERLVTPPFMELLRQVNLSFIAVDEAHCISAWGHDFRPEYRALRVLRETFPNLGIHGYTATATRHVRDDIATQLDLREPEMLVGDFDRPNLTYRVQRRTDVYRQVEAILKAHEGDAGIVYCIRRADVDDLCGALRAKGYRVLPYHAGLGDDERKRHQDAFLREEVDTVVATVAFGMGIDKSNVRYVIHAGMPKSLEHYQQETGRAGRDGLEAECTLLFSGTDYQVWKHFLRDSDPEARRVAQTKLDDMLGFCAGVTCRHKALVNYFGQAYEKAHCRACDLCMDEVELVEDPYTITAKILSCVVRLKEMFGADHTASVLVGAREARILQRRHDRLSTFGIMKEHSKREVRDWLEQLVEQGFLEKAGEYNTLRLTMSGRQALRGEVTPRLLKPATKHASPSKCVETSWAGVDRELFEALRTLRRTIAEERQVPAYVVFSDAALRDMARKRPTSREALLHISGVGRKKCADYGNAFIKVISQYSKVNPDDVRLVPDSADEGGSLPAGTFGNAPPRAGKRKAASAKETAFAMFAQGRDIDSVAQHVRRAVSTVSGYLEEYLEAVQADGPEPWVDQETFARVCKVADALETDRLRPIYDALQGDVGFDAIRFSIICRRNAGV